MSKQPEALRLANLLDEECVVNWIHATGGAPRACGTKPHKLSVDAAAELRSLHAANAELVEALSMAAAFREGGIEKARAALSKHKEQA